MVRVSDDCDWSGSKVSSVESERSEMKAGTTEMRHLKKMPMVMTLAMEQRMR